MLGNIEALLNPSGRVSLQALERLAAASGAEEFVRLLMRPVLAGANIYDGSLAERRRREDLDPNRTLAFKLETSECAEHSSETLRLAVYPLVKGPDTTRALHIFTVGRTNANDLVIPDIAISKRHAIIEIAGGERFFVRDRGSTNGTLLNGRPIGGTNQAIRDGDIIAFARYEFGFLSPRSLYERLVAH